MSGHVSDDCEMSDVREITEHLSPKSSSSAAGTRSAPHRPPVSGSTTSSRNSEDSVSLANDIEVISVSSRGNSLEPPESTVIVDAKPTTPQQHNQPESAPLTTPSIKPTSTTAAAAAPAPSKPKSTKVVRPRSRSPSPPPPPPPLQTIRLDIRLGGPDNYEVDISHMAKETGQRPPTPVAVVKRDISDSEGEDDGDGEPKNAGEPSKPPSKTRRKKKNLTAEYYDVHDPFIDDSELALDERTYFAQTKQQGFYVSSGEVALLKDKTPRKPKSRKPGPAAKADATTAAAAGPSNLSTIKREGTKDSPIALGSDEEDAKPGQKRKRYTTVMENGKKRRVVNIHDFHPALQEAIDELKGAIAKENWDHKGKFPPGIKPLLAQVALKAVALDEYDDHFFNLMPVLFPYNKFTMSKLIKRTIFQDHLDFLNLRQTNLLEELSRLTEEGFAKAQEEWEKTVSQWEAKQEKIKEAEAKAGEESAAGAPPPSARQSTEDAASGMEQEPPPPPALTQGGEGETPKVAGKPEPHPPSKKYRMTETMKGIVWQLVSLSNECCRLENEKNSLEGNNNQVSEQGLRKGLYQRIVAAFPDGWMSSGQISRDVSSMKKKYEKGAMEIES